MKKAVILFTRVPIPGKTKTRMMPALSGEACAKLHICFLKDIWMQCRQEAADVFVCYTPEDEKGILTSILGKEARYVAQQGESLGERMYHAFEQIFQAEHNSYEACVLIGADVPELSLKDLNQAFAMLKKSDVVLGPTEDGGYYLIGMKRLIKEAFQKQEYGHGDVLGNTRKGLLEHGFTTSIIERHSDMDTIIDLKGYLERAKGNHGLADSATRIYVESIWKNVMKSTMSISIIVPVYNEEKTIITLQKQLKKLENDCEILFVDGGSTDGTLKQIEASFPVIHTSKGRAKQMNEGAKASKGNILFFLHCDSELPDNPIEQIQQVMKTYRAGCFGVAFHSRNFFMLTCSIISNHRIKDRKVMFGDQGIFIDRDLFFDIGMFPEIPIMEDYQLSLNLKARGERLGIAKKRIYTSDRRFPKGTIAKLKVMWKMNRLRKAYRQGVSVFEIAARYEDIR